MRPIRTLFVVLLYLLLSATTGIAAADTAKKKPQDNPANKSALDLSSTGNPSLAPLKWSGMLVTNNAEKGTSTRCSAQFISPKVLLTAAHCVQDSDTGEWLDIGSMFFLL